MKFGVDVLIASYESVAFFLGNGTEARHLLNFSAGDEKSIILTVGLAVHLIVSSG
jgi:hypothetical protein